MKMTTDLYRNLIKEQYNISDVLNKRYKDRHYSPGYPCFCPFHENNDTPAAMIYDNEDGETLYCFAERKNYDSSDALEELFKKDINEIGANIWNSLSEQEKNDFLIRHKKIDYEELFSEESTEEKIDFKPTAEKFKYGKIKYTDLLFQFINYTDKKKEKE